VTHKASDVSAKNMRTWSRRYSAFSYRRAEGLFAAEEKIFDEFQELLRTSRLLDLGIGTGRTTAELAHRAGSYVGCDYSASMIALAKARHPGKDLRIADARDLIDFKDGSFDIVLFSFNGIDGAGHDDRLRIMAAVARVLRHDGLFIMSSHNRAVESVPAHALSNLALSWNPLRLAYGLALYSAGIWNQLRLKGGEREEREFALVNDGAHQYALLQYYIYPEDQVRQLEGAGFVDVKCYDLAGERLVDPAAPSGDYMIHYVSRKGFGSRPEYGERARNDPT
jgi:SAM-dependent methyltransferase